VLPARAHGVQPEGARTAEVGADDLQARAERLNGPILELFTKLVVARRHEILHPVPVVAAGFVARMISAMLVSRLLDPKFVPAGLSFVDELTHAALAYLGVFPEDAIDVL
jgi:hypothetical protein